MESRIQDKDEVRAGAERARKELSDAGNRIQRQAEDIWEDVSELVKKHPAKALGITLLSGVAFGILTGAVSRRRSNASDNLRDLAGSGTEAWDKVREGFEDAVCTMKDAFEEAVSKFK